MPSVVSGIPVADANTFAFPAWRLSNLYAPFTSVVTTRPLLTPSMIWSVAFLTGAVVPVARTTPESVVGVGGAAGSTVGPVWVSKNRQPVPSTATTRTSMARRYIDLDSLQSKNPDWCFQRQEAGQPSIELPDRKCQSLRLKRRPTARLKSP